MTNEERIKADAQRFTKDEGYQKLYIAGATAEFERAYHIGIQLKAQDSNVEILLQQKNDLNDQAKVLADAMEELTQLKEAYYNLDESLKEVQGSYKQAIDLLTEVFQKHESGLLPDRFIYEEIKKFLYGE